MIGSARLARPEPGYWNHVRPVSQERCMIKVFGTPPTRALRVLWMLEEMGLEYEICPVDFARRHDDAEFLEARAFPT